MARRLRSKLEESMIKYVPCDNNNTVRKCFVIFKQRPAIFLFNQLPQSVVFTSYNELLDTFQRRAVKRKINK